MKKILSFLLLISLIGVNNAFAVKNIDWTNSAYSLSEYSVSDILKKKVNNNQAEYNYWIDPKGEGYSTSRAWERYINGKSTTEDIKIRQSLCTTDTQCKAYYYPAIKFNYEQYPSIKGRILENTKVFNNLYAVNQGKEKNFQYIESTYGTGVYKYIIDNQGSLEKKYTAFIDKERQDLKDEKFTKKNEFGKDVKILYFNDYTYRIGYPKLLKMKVLSKDKLNKAIVDFYIWKMLGDKRLYIKDYEKQNQVSLIEVKPVVKTNTGIVVNSVPKNTSTNVSRNNNANESTIGKYPNIKTVEELKKYVKEFNNGVSFNSELDVVDYISNSGVGYFLNPNNIDWSRGWDYSKHQYLSENALLYCGNTYYYTVGGYTKKIQKGGLSDEDYEKTKKELENLVGTLIAGKNSDEEKIKVIFDWIHQNIKYDISRHGQDKTPITVYKNRTGVCDGFSQLFYFMRKKAGIQDVHIIGGTLDGFPHAWNKIGNNYYDPTNNYYNFRDLSKYKLIEEIIR